MYPAHQGEGHSERRHAHRAQQAAQSRLCDHRDDDGKHVEHPNTPAHQDEKHASEYLREGTEEPHSEPSMYNGGSRTHLPGQGGIEPPQAKFDSLVHTCVRKPDGPMQFKREENTEYIANREGHVAPLQAGRGHKQP